MTKALPLVAMLALAAPVFGQEEVSVTGGAEGDDSVRRRYIHSFPDHFFLYPVLKQRALSFDITAEGTNELLSYRPNNSYSIGVGAYLFEIGAELTFAIPLNERQKSIYGTSDSRDIFFNLLGKRWGVDAFWQRYSGFYVRWRGHEPARGQPFPQRPDITSRNYGLSGYYIFNWRKFSFRSFYNFAERQLSSRGSPLLSVTIRSFRVAGDGSIIDDAHAALFQPAALFSRLRYTTLSLAPGYTYSLVHENFFLNGTLSVGPAQQWIRYHPVGGTVNYDIGVNMFVAARVGLGYNSERLFGGISFLSQGSMVKLEGVEFSNSNSSFKILVGYRFREKGILRIRALDLLPFEL